MIVHANAKLNLNLFVTGKDSSDGYHTIHSLFQEINWADEIEIKPAPKDSVEFKGIEIFGDTTVHRALRFFKEISGLKQGFSIFVKKNIPIGAGLGGGSSDAAAVLKALNSFHPVPREKLFDIARRIGSDVPFFLNGGLALVEGKGEKITPVNSFLSEVWFLVVYPNIHISTAEAYSWIKAYNHPPDLKILKKKQALSVDFLKKIMYNTFQKFVMKRLPDLRAFYDKLYSEFHHDAIMMSGSGSALFLVYSDYNKASRDFKTLKSTEKVSCGLCEPVYSEAANQRTFAETGELIISRISSGG